MVIHRGQQKVLWIYYDGYGSGFVMVSSCIHAMHHNAKKKREGSSTGFHELLMNTLCFVIVVFLFLLIKVTKGPCV